MILHFHVSSNPDKLTNKRENLADTFLMIITLALEKLRFKS